MQIHQNLKWFRTQCGLTQEQAAERLHTTRQTISSYETGRTQPDLDTLARLAGLYGVPVEHLLYGDRDAARRIRLGRTCWITVIVYLAGLALLSAGRLAVNLLLPIPGLTAGGSVSITEELRPLVELRFALGDALDGFHGLWVLALLIVLLVLLFQDLSLRSPGPLRRRALPFLVLAAGSFAVTVPFGLFDPLFGTANYRISAEMGLLFLVPIVLIDLTVWFWRRFRSTSAVGSS